MRDGIRGLAAVAIAGVEAGGEGCDSNLLLLPPSPSSDFMYWMECGILVGNSSAIPCNEFSVVVASLLVDHTLFKCSGSGAECDAESITGYPKGDCAQVVEVDNDALGGGEVCIDGEGKGDWDKDSVWNLSCFEVG